MIEQVSNIYWGCVDPEVPFFTPRRSTRHAAAHDLFLPYPLDIYPGDVTEVRLNINCCMPADFCAKVYVRSSIGTKYNIVLANGTGIIDADYYNEWCLYLYTHERDIDEFNDPDSRRHYDFDDASTCLRFEEEERIAQVVFEKVPEYEVCNKIYSQDEIKEMIMDRGSNRHGGFGSTGK